jgi:uncharacterized protein involved in exopolysaccharide biosynthesis
LINPRLQDSPTEVLRGQQVSIADTGPAPRTPVLGGIARYWKFIAVIVTACVAATVGYVFAVPPKWEASARVLVVPVPANADMPGLGLVSDSVEPARTLQTAIALLDTPAAEAATAAKLGAPWSSASVEQSISLQPLGQSYVVEVTAKTDSASTASRLATTFAQTALETRDSEIKQRAAGLLAQRLRLPTSVRSKFSSVSGAQLELIARTGDPSLSMAQPAIPPRSPVGLPAQYKIALSAVLGLCLAVAGAWARARGARPDERTRVPAYAPVGDGWDR